MDDASSSLYKAEVLSAFSKVSPSAITIEDPDIYEQYVDRYNTLFRYHLNFPPELFANRSVIDFGCGTGEFDLLLATWGADILGFDFNEKSIERAFRLRDALAAHHISQLNFQIGDVSSFAIQNESYDIAISMGVLAHVPEQHEMYSRMANAIRPGGYLILGFIEDSGLIQRLMHREIVKALAQTDEAEVFRIANTLFGEHIQRSVRHGNRTEQSVINDYLVNPHYDGVSSQTLDNWAEDLGLTYYSSWPHTRLPFPVDSIDESMVPRTTDTFRTFLSHNRIRWMLANDSDNNTYTSILEHFISSADLIEALISSLTRALQSGNLSSLDLDTQRALWNDLHKELRSALNSTSENILTGIELFAGEVLDVLTFLTTLGQEDIRGQEDISESGLPITEHLFHGYNGLGTTTTIWYKP